MHGFELSTVKDTDSYCAQSHVVFMCLFLYTKNKAMVILQGMSERVDLANTDALVEAALTSLSSKVYREF